MTYEIPNWPTKPPTWKQEYIDLLTEGTIDPKPKTEDITNIINKSNKFPIKFPINSILCKTLTASVNKETLQRNIDSAYPLIHEYALYLCVKFLLYKRKNGTKIEQNFYKNLTIIDFIDRLLKNRAAVFVGKWDSWILMDGSKGAGKWDTIGKDNEKHPLILENCISYDEIKLSVFLSVSSFSYFINNGTRKNKGIPAKVRSDIEPEGIVIGLIGARFKKQNAMEFQEIMITESQNTLKNGYGDITKETLPTIFANLYEEPSFTYEHVLSKISSGGNKNERFTDLQNGQFFDNVVYSKRLSLSIDTLLLEANYRSEMAKKSAYIHVVGIGLGVWKISSHQINVFIETFFQRINTLGDKLKNVSDVDFSYIGVDIKVKNYFDGNFIKIPGHPNGGIKIYVSKRDPYTKLQTPGKLLVVSFAWDGNSLPGNEFWKGQLGSTGDSSTASSSQVAELHNPHINGMVSAKNLMVVTSSDGHVTIQDYIEKLKKCQFTSSSDVHSEGINYKKMIKTPKESK